MNDFYNTKLLPLINYVEKNQHIMLLLLSIFFLLVAYIVKKIIFKTVDRDNSLDSNDKIVSKAGYANTINLSYLIILAIIWFSSLQSAFVSLFAIAAALAIATKELIMCFMGGVLIKINHHFKITDRIQVHGVRGFVIEKNLTTTKILEIGPEKYSQQTTGKVITIPNSLMLNKSVINESYFKGFSIKTFNFKMPKELDFEEIEVEVLKWGKDISEGYYQEAKTSIKEICQREGIVLPSMSPRTKIALDENNDCILILKIPVKNKVIADIEQEILRKYYRLISSKLKEVKAQEQTPTVV